MKPKASVKHQLVNKFLKDMNRAVELYEKFTEHAVIRNPNGTTSPLMNPDRRDLAAYIFLEAASSFESFAYNCFELTVRKHYKVTQRRAEFIMGSSDRGTGGVYGWASPAQLKKRGKNLFGRKRFFGKFNYYLTATRRERLRQAHLIRNRIAHSGSSAPEEYHNLLQTLKVPKSERSGLSAGRLLMEYPPANSPSKRLFYLYIGTYKTFAQKFSQYG